MKSIAAFTLLICGMATASGADLKGLVSDLGSKDPDLRRSAARALGELGVEAKPAVPYLIRAMKDQDVFVRRFAAHSLGQIGPAKGAVAALKGALDDSNARVVDAAAKALGGMGASGVEPLTVIIKNKKLTKNTRVRAINSLTAIGPEAKEAVPALIDALKDAEIRLETAQALGAIGAPAMPAVKVMETMLEDRRIKRDRSFTRAARMAMRQIQKNGKQKKKK